MQKKNIKVKPGEKVELMFTKGRLELFLGSKNNKVVLEYLSPWFNFKDKDKFLTRKLYVYDPKFYKPKKPTSRARKLIGDDELIILGSLRNKIYFSSEGKWDDKLEKEHVKLLYKYNGKLIIENVSKDLITVE